MRTHHMGTLSRRMAVTVAAAVVAWAFLGTGLASAHSSSAVTASSLKKAQCTPKAGDWYCVTFGATEANPTITITGSDFGSIGTGVPAGCSATGDDYPYDNLYITDVTRGFNGGQATSSPDGSLDCLGLVVTSASSTQIVFTFGSQYTAASGFETGNKFVVGVVIGVAGGVPCFGTVPAYPATVKCPV